MKKLILLLTLVVAIGINANAQWGLQKDAGYNYFENDGDFITHYVGVSGDAFTASDSTITKTVLINADQPLEYEIKVGLDSTGTADSVMTYIQNRVFYTDEWTDTDSTKWYMSSSDTSFKFTETSTGLNDRYWRVLSRKYSSSAGGELDYLNFSWDK